MCFKSLVPMLNGGNGYFPKPIQSIRQIQLFLVLLLWNHRAIERIQMNEMYCCTRSFSFSYPFSNFFSSLPITTSFDLLHVFILTELPLFVQAPGSAKVNYLADYISHDVCFTNLADINMQWLVSCYNPWGGSSAPQQSIMCRGKKNETSS